MHEWLRWLLAHVLRWNWMRLLQLPLRWLLHYWCICWQSRQGICRGNNRTWVQMIQFWGLIAHVRAVAHTSAIGRVPMGHQRQSVGLDSVCWTIFNRVHGWRGLLLLSYACWGWWNLRWMWRVTRLLMRDSSKMFRIFEKQKRNK